MKYTRLKMACSCCPYMTEMWYSMAITPKALQWMTLTPVGDGHTNASFIDVKTLY